MNWEPFTAQLFVQLLNRSAQELALIYEMSEGLEHRIKQALPKLNPRQEALVEQLLELLKTKRYTRTKLQRTLLRILLNHHKHQLNREQLAAGTPYLRILGFSAKGQQLLKRMKKTAKAPIVTNACGHSAPFLEMDIRAASVYAAAYPSPSADQLFRDYYQSPLRLGSDS